MFKRFISLLLVLSLGLCLVPVAALAAETEPAATEPPAQTQPEETQPAETEPAETQAAETQPAGDLILLDSGSEAFAPDEDEDAYYENQELEYGYIENLFQPNEAVPFGITARDNLNALDRRLYDLLLPKIQNVAVNGGSTEFTINVSDLGVGGIYYNGTVAVGGYLTDAASAAMWNALPDCWGVVRALRYDTPYELYWYDFSIGCYRSASGISYNSSTKMLTVTTITVKLSVNAAYGSGYNVTKNMSSAVAAAANARAIVATHAGKSDYEKLLAYKETICSMVTYDTYAANNDTFQSNDNPWQMVYAFDNNSSTNIVCEGYARAFQYLCDQSTFQGDVYALYVAGDAGGGHAWNIVHIGGANYTVDVTWCDTDSITEGDTDWFMVPPVSGSVTGGYTYPSGSTRTYDDITLERYTTQQLTLSSTAYVPPTGGQCGDNAYWVLDNGVLTISGTGAMWDYREGYTSNNNPAPWDKEQVRSLVVNNGITYLGDNAFCYCYDLSSVSISGSVAGLGYYCFEDCTSLTSVSLPYGMVYIYDSAFRGCTNLTEITLPNSVKLIAGGAFYECESLDHVVIPSSVTSLGEYCFAWCSSLSSLTVPSSVTSIGESAFAQCVSLSRITFQGNAPSIGEDAFYNVTTTAYYPVSDSTWTSSVKQNYGGSVTWQASTQTHPMYRLYNQYTYEHLFLTDPVERADLIRAGWTDEGIGWYAAPTGDLVYRLYNPYGNFHFYSKTWSEVQYLLTLGWSLDGAVTCDAGSGGIPIYRLFNPYVTTNYHHYTTGLDEALWLQSLGWVLEGVAWYAAG